MEYVSMSIQQSPDRAAHKGRHAYESIELHQFGALVRRPSPRGAEGLETWALPAWRAPGLACKSGCKRTQNA